MRFVTPQEFHSEEAWKSLKKNPGDLLQEWIKGDYRIDRAEIREESGQKYMSGYIIMPKEHIKELLAHSGQKTVFITTLARDRVGEQRPPCRWIPKNKEEPSADYLTRIRAAAAEGGDGAPKPLAFRIGRAGLGVIGLEPMAGRSIYILRGGPLWWGPEAITEHLTKHQRQY